MSSSTQSSTLFRCSRCKGQGARHLCRGLVAMFLLVRRDDGGLDLSCIRIDDFDNCTIYLKGLFTEQ
jgi:hypothetical protein